MSNWQPMETAPKDGQIVWIAFTCETGVVFHAKARFDTDDWWARLDGLFIPAERALGWHEQLELPPLPTEPVPVPPTEGPPKCVSYSPA